MKGEIQMEVNDRFPVLSTIAKLMWKVGVFIIIIGLIPPNL